MNISYLSTFYPFRGGISQFNALLYNELSKTNQVKAFTFKRQYPEILFPGKSQMVQNYDKTIKINSNRILDSINPISYYKTAKEINIFNPKLNLMKFWMPFFAPSLGKTARLLKKNGTKNITILDNVIPHEGRIGDLSLIKYFINSNDAFIVMSNSVKNDLLKISPNAKYKFLEHPIYNQFSDKINKDIALQKLELDTSKKYILFFGFIRKYKGLDLLIKAMKFLPNDIELIVAGEVYGKFDEYQKLIEDENLIKRIHLFTNYIADNEVSIYFSASDACVLPYRSATQSGITGIAYNFDVPLIATDTGSLKEVIEPYNCGEIIQEISPESIADSILKFYCKDANSFKTGIQKYKDIANWSFFAKGILDLYNEII